MKHLAVVSLYVWARLDCLGWHLIVGMGWGYMLTDTVDLFSDRNMKRSIQWLPRT